MARVFAIDDIDSPPPPHQLAVAVSVFQGFQRTHNFHGFTPMCYVPAPYTYMLHKSRVKLNLIRHATSRQPTIAVGDFVEILLVVFLGKIIGGAGGNLSGDAWSAVCR